MAKTESTAVNELINLVQTQKPLPPDPSEDLMFSQPKPSAKKASVPRMTQTVPPVNVAGEVAPLPRARAPQGTSQQQVPQVRVATAPVRNSTIPPIPSQPAKPSQRTLPPPIPTAPSAPQNPANNQTLMGVSPTVPPMGGGETFDGGVATIKSMPPMMVDGKQTLMGHAAEFDGGVATIKMPERVSKQLAASHGPAPIASPRSTMLGAPAPSVVSAIPPIPMTPSRPTAPPSMPVAAPFETKAGHMLATSTMPLIGAPKMIEPQAYPVVVPPPVVVEPPAHAHAHAPHDMTSHQTWFDDHQSAPFEHHPDPNTAQVKRADWKAIAGKLILPMIGLTILGIFVGGYFAFDGDGGKKRAPKQKPAAAAKVETKAAPAATPTPAAETAKADVAVAATAEPAAPPVADDTKASDATQAPAAVATADRKPEPMPEGKQPEAKPAITPEPAKPATVDTSPAPAVTPPNLVGTANDPAKLVPPGKPVFVDVRIDSRPAGATVMLVDRGKTSFLGTTPISTAVDPSRSYELVFTYENRPTQVAKLDPAATKRVTIELGKRGKRSASKPDAPKRVAGSLDGFVETKQPAKTAIRPDTVVDPFAKQAPAAQGVLMISSKPPCEILVDGVRTGLTTPQRAMKLPVGKHKITLVNTSEKIKKTLAIEITADQPTKVIQDLMK